MEHVGFTNISNNFHDSPNYGSGSRGFSKIMEIVGFTNIFREQVMEKFFLPTISMILQTTAPAPEVSRNSWKLLELLVLPTVCMSKSWKMLVLPTISMMPGGFPFGGAQRNC